MAAVLQVTDGNPVWLSPAVIPSKDTVIAASGGCSGLTTRRWIRGRTENSSSGWATPCTGPTPAQVGRGGRSSPYRFSSGRVGHTRTKRGTNFPRKSLERAAAAFRHTRPPRSRDRRLSFTTCR